jgi:hypothetical protein
MGQRRREQTATAQPQPAQHDPGQRREAHSNDDPCHHRTLGPYPRPCPFGGCPPSSLRSHCRHSSSFHPPASETRSGVPRHRHHHSLLTTTPLPWARAASARWRRWPRWPATMAGRAMLRRRSPGPGGPWQVVDFGHGALVSAGPVFWSRLDRRGMHREQARSRLEPTRASRSIRLVQGRSRVRIPPRAPNLRSDGASGVAGCPAATGGHSFGSGHRARPFAVLVCRPHPG